MYPYAVCGERTYTSRLTFKNEEAAKAWLSSNLNSVVYLELTPEMVYLQARTAAGLLFNQDSTADEFMHYAITDSGIHTLQFRDADGVLAAAPGRPLSDYKPIPSLPSAKEKARAKGKRRTSTRASKKRARASSAR